MKIGINGHFFKYPASGIGQYLLHTANAMLEIDQQNDYVLFGHGVPIPEGFRHPQLYSTHLVPAWAKSNGNIEAVIWEQYSCPTMARKAKVDLLHYPYLAVPLFSSTPTVVTIPDMIHFRLPHYLEGTLKKAYLKMNMQAAHKAAMIITLSEHAKQDIVDLMHVSPERVRVIYIAAGDEYHPVLDPCIRAEVRERYGLGKRYIFYLGGLDLRKNVLQLVRAFAQLCQRIDDPNLQLFIAGDPDKQVGPKALHPDPRPLAAALGVADRLICRFVEERDKATLYSAAEVFVFPSIYEGFGLPPLEAMKCGAPIICSNRTSLPEVVGDAAISLNPGDTGILVDAMYDVLTNHTLQDDLRARSLQRANLFNWNRTAGETINIYEEVISKKGEWQNVPHCRASPW